MEPNATSIVLNATLNQPSPIVLNATLNQTSQVSWNDWLPLILFVFAAALSLITWGLTEWARRSTKRHLRKTERYVELIDLIENLMENKEKKPGDPDLRIKFIHQINLCWLHCPDDVIRKTTDLVSKFNNDGISLEKKEEALSELMITLRKDVLKKTKLNNADYEKLRPAMLRHFVLKAESGAFKVAGTADFSMHVDSKEKVTVPPKK
jgi:hypothetical protein